MLAAGIPKTRNSQLSGRATLIYKKNVQKKILNNSIQAYKINIPSEQEHFVLDFSPPLPPLEYSICSRTQNKSYIDQGRGLGRMKED